MNRIAVVASTDYAITTIVVAFPILTLCLTWYKQHVAYYKQWSTCEHKLKKLSACSLEESLLYFNFDIHAIAKSLSLVSKQSFYIPLTSLRVVTKRPKSERQHAKTYQID